MFFELRSSFCNASALIIQKLSGKINRIFLEFQNVFDIFTTRKKWDFLAGIGTNSTKRRISMEILHFGES